MTSDQYVLWFILMAVGIAVILGLGTLTMAGLLHRPWHHDSRTDARRRHAADHRHHWYDRFHHAT